MIKASDPAGQVRGTLSGRQTGLMPRIRDSVQHAFQLAPHALSMMILVAHASVITDVVSHISSMKLVLASALFALWYFSHSGSEEL